MILNDTNISCRDVLRGLWFSTKFSCDFSIFFCAHSVLHTKISTENSCICRGVLHSRQIGKSASREYSEAGGAWGRRLHSARLYCCEKAHRSLPRCAAAFLCCLSCFLRQFFHNPALALFFRGFLAAEKSAALWETPSAVRNVPCAAISLRPGCVIYLTVRIALRDRSV